MLLRCTILALVSALLVVPAFAERLVFAGVLGNSGGEGPTVIHSTVGRSGGGVVTDARGRIFTGGGDRILTLSPRGTLLWETPMPKPGWVLGGPAFAVAGSYLYFIAGVPVRHEGSYHYLWNPFSLVEPNLCRVMMTYGAKAEILAGPADLKWINPWWSREVTLTAAPNATTVYVGMTTAGVVDGNYTHTGYAVWEVKPDGKLAQIYTTPISGGRVSVDEAGNFYLGGGGMVRKFDKAWQPASGFTPVPLPSLGAVASNYTGSVMLTRGAIWDMGHYGFVGRYTREMKPDPGVVIQWEHALGYVGQIADAPGGNYYIKSDDTLYLAAIINDRLKLQQRFGSLPEIYNLTLTPAGYVGVGNDSRLLWFDFDAPACASAPVRCQFFGGPSAQGIADGPVNLLTIGTNPIYFTRDYTPAPKGFVLQRYAAEPFVGGANSAEAQAYGEYDGRLDALTRVGDWYFAMDGKNSRLLNAKVSEPAKLSPVALTLPGAPTSITALANRYLLVAAHGSVTACLVSADGALTPSWTLSDKFGDELYLSTSGNLLLVSDTNRHVVKLYTVGDRPDAIPMLLTRYGEDSIAGNDFAHFDHPTLLSLSGTRAVVYDSGNQRVVKLTIQ